MSILAHVLANTAFQGQVTGCTHCGSTFKAIVRKMLLACWEIHDTQLVERSSQSYIVRVLEATTQKRHLSYGLISAEAKAGAQPG
eukprot:scaffold279642_cov17-Tisochrysis_lutea.AAC.2